MCYQRYSVFRWAVAFRLLSPLVEDAAYYFNAQWCSNIFWSVHTKMIFRSSVAETHVTSRPTQLIEGSRQLLSASVVDHWTCIIIIPWASTAELHIPTINTILSIPTQSVPFALKPVMQENLSGLFSVQQALRVKQPTFPKCIELHCTKRFLLSDRRNVNNFP